MNFQGGGKLRPYYTRAWRADPCSGRGDPCGLYTGRFCGEARGKGHGGRRSRPSQPSSAALAPTDWWWSFHKTYPC